MANKCLGKKQKQKGIYRVNPIYWGKKNAPCPQFQALSQITYYDFSLSLHDAQDSRTLILHIILSLINFILFLKNVFMLFIYFWLCCNFVAVHDGLSLVAASRGYLSLQCAQASHCSGFSCCGARAPGMRASVVAAGSVVVARGL